MSRSTFAAVLLLVLPAYASLAGCNSNPTDTNSGVSQDARPPQTAKDSSFARRCDRDPPVNGPTTLKRTTICKVRDLGRVSGATAR